MATRRFLKKKLQALIDVLDYPKLLFTVGRSIDRGFARELLFIRKSLGLSLNTILDIGAADGSYTRAARFAFPDAIIHAFEPVESSFREIQQLAERDANIFAHQCALGNRDGPISFFQNEYSFSSSTLPMLDRHKEVFPFTKSETIVTVESRRLDSFEQLTVRRPALMKIDVQGAELEVIKGAERVLQNIDVLRVEISFEMFYKGQASYDRLVACTSELGFRSFVQVDPQYSKTKPAQLFYCDLLFLR